MSAKKSTISLTTVCSDHTPACSPIGTTTVSKLKASLPQYTKDDKWDVVLTGPGAEPLEVSVRPTSRVGLLLKAWASEYGGDSVDYQLEVKSGSSWTSGVANAESLIGDSGVVDGLQVVITKI